MKCNCGKNAFTYLDMETGLRYYRCNETSINVSFKPKKIIKKEKNLPCKFRKEIQEFEPKPPELEKEPEKKSKFIIPKETELEKLQRITQFFLQEKDYTLFQEIEILCKSLNIPTKKDEESIYEFTQRIVTSSKHSPN